MAAKTDTMASHNAFMDEEDFMEDEDYTGDEDPAGSGDSEDEDTSEYTPIYTIAELAEINNNPKGKYVLKNDIDMTEETKEGGLWDSGHGWTPLDSFSGTLDGAGHRIIGMHIYGELALEGAGLFSELYGGIVRNLGMVEVDIEDVSVQGDAQTRCGIGAITGVISQGAISGCYVTGSISGTRNVGGLAGHDWYSKITNSYNAASVDGNGFVGFYEQGEDESYYKCYNIGKVTGKPIIDCDWADQNMQKNTYALKGNSQDDTYTTMLTEAQMKTQSMFTGFDFENVWEMDPNSTYSYPQLQSNRHQRVEKIKIVSAPSTTTYNQGDEINLSGGKVQLIYEGNYETTVVMTDDMLEDYDMMQLGEQDITLKYGGQETSFKITIKEIPVESIHITGTDASLSKGNSIQLEAEVKPDNATDQTVTWDCDQPEVASVDQSGKVTAFKVGNAVITATAKNGISEEYAISVTAPCTLLLLDQAELTLYKGSTANLIPTVSPVDTTDTVSWSSSDSNVVKVAGNGCLTGCAVGKANVTATAGSRTAVCSVTVKQKLDGFSVTGIVDKDYTGSAQEQSVVITDGNVVLEKGKDYTVSYSNNVKVGTAKISITGIGLYEGNIERTFSIKETNATKTSTSQTKKQQTKKVKAKKVTLNKTKLTLTVGKKAKLKLQNCKKKVKWSSSKKKIATVNKKGVVKAKKKGKAKITAKVGKKKYICKVTVKAKKKAKAITSQKKPASTSQNNSTTTVSQSNPTKAPQSTSTKAPQSTATNAPESTATKAPEITATKVPQSTA
ncbi:MAG: Ig-like domain-containing protein, partial [Lachnospiraceae bacterium]|nr:Ig-like domain-containing protein [Lachnospiraceae bacterium]